MKYLLIILLSLSMFIEDVKAFLIEKQHYEFLDRHFKRMGFRLTNNDANNNQDARIFGGYDPIDQATQNQDYIVTGTLTTGSSPLGVAIDNDGRIWIPNALDDDVSVFDSNETLLTTVATGTIPADIVYNPILDRIYIANQGSSNITVINASTQTVLATVSTGATPDDMAVDLQTGNVYALSRAVSSTIHVIGSDNTVSTTISIGNNSGGTSGMGYSPVSRRIYASNETDGTISIINPSTNTVVATVSSLVTSPKDIIFSSATNRSYVIGTDGIASIDANNNTIRLTTNTTDYVRGTFNENNNNIYIVDSTGGNVDVLQIGDTLGTAISIGSGPFGIAYSSTTTKMYAANFDDDTASILEAPITIESFRDNQVDFNFINNSVKINPIKLHHVKLIYPNDNDLQLNESFTIEYTDGAGVDLEVPMSPAAYVSSNMNNNILEMYSLKGLELSGYTAITFTLRPSTSITVFFYYREFGILYLK